MKVVKPTRRYTTIQEPTTLQPRYAMIAVTRPKRLPTQKAAEATAGADLRTNEGNPDFVHSLARGLKVIETFEGHLQGMTVADAARSAGISRAAARRLLMTLESLGYVEATGRVYRLRTRVLRLGYSYLSSTSLTASAQSVLDGITEKIHESSSMSALDGDEIVYLARAVASQVMSIGLSVGSRLPAYCTSMGRVLLAALPDEELAAYLARIRPKAHTPRTITSKPQLRAAILKARADRYAIVDEELQLGLLSIAVPVQNRQNRTVAAINIGVHALQVTPKQIARFLPLLRESAFALTQLLR